MSVLLTNHQNRQLPLFQLHGEGHRTIATTPAIDNPEHLAILKEGVETWNEWRVAIEAGLHIERVNSGEPAFVVKRWVGADLSDAVLGDANLSEADLSGVNLRRADLRRVDLRGASLATANWHDL